MVEKAITEAEGKIGSDIADSQKRFFAIKLLERDAKIGDYFRTVPNVADEIMHLKRLLTMTLRVLSPMNVTLIFLPLLENAQRRPGKRTI